MRKIFLGLLIFIGLSASAQVPATVSNPMTGGNYDFKNYAMVEKGFFPPINDTNWLPVRAGAIENMNGVMFYWNGHVWVNVSGNAPTGNFWKTTDTTNVNNPVINGQDSTITLSFTGSYLPLSVTNKWGTRTNDALQVYDGINSSTTGDMSLFYLESMFVDNFGDTSNNTVASISNGQILVYYTNYADGSSNAILQANNNYYEHNINDGTYNLSILYGDENEIDMYTGNLGDGVSHDAMNYTTSDFTVSFPKFQSTDGTYQDVSTLHTQSSGYFNTTFPYTDGDGVVNSSDFIDADPNSAFTIQFSNANDDDSRYANQTLQDQYDGTLLLWGNDYNSNSGEWEQWQTLQSDVTALRTYVLVRDDAKDGTDVQTSYIGSDEFDTYGSVQDGDGNWNTYNTQQKLNTGDYFQSAAYSDVNGFGSYQQSKTYGSDGSLILSGSEGYNDDGTIAITDYMYAQADYFELDNAVKNSSTGFYEEKEIGWASYGGTGYNGIMVNDDGSFDNSNVYSELNNGSFNLYGKVRDGSGFYQTNSTFYVNPNGVLGLNSTGSDRVTNFSRIQTGADADTALIALNNSIVDISDYQNGSGDYSAVLSLHSNTRGFLPPVMTSSQRDAIALPTTGLTLYCSDCLATDLSTGVMQTFNGLLWKNNW